MTDTSNVVYLAVDNPKPVTLAELFAAGTVLFAAGCLIWSAMWLHYCRDRRHI